MPVEPSCAVSRPRAGRRRALAALGAPRVSPAAFAYQRAETVDDALQLLGNHGSDGKLIAGGQSLLPLMKLRLARPELLIDIGRLEGLRGVRELPDGRLALGEIGRAH